jgi:hypothetical protein
MFADGAGITTKMVSTDDGGLIPAMYGDFMKVYSISKAENHPPCWSMDYAVNLEPK